MDPQGANVGREIFPISSPDFLAFCIIGVFCNMPSCFKMELYIDIYIERERERERERSDFWSKGKGKWKIQTSELHFMKCSF